MRRLRRQGVLRRLNFKSVHYQFFASSVSENADRESPTPDRFSKPLCPGRRRGYDGRNQTHGERP